MPSYTKEQLKTMLRNPEQSWEAVTHIESLVPKRIMHNGKLAFHHPGRYAWGDKYFPDTPFAYYQDGSFFFKTMEEANSAGISSETCDEYSIHSQGQ